MNFQFPKLLTFLHNSPHQIYIDNRPFIAADDSFTSYEPTSAPTSYNNHIILGIAVCGSISVGLVLFTLIVFLRCFWQRNQRKTKGPKRKGSPTENLLPTAVLKVTHTESHAESSHAL